MIEAVNVFDAMLAKCYQCGTEEVTVLAPNDTKQKFTERLLRSGWTMEHNYLLCSWCTPFKPKTGSK